MQRNCEMLQADKPVEIFHGLLFFTKLDKTLY
jgi:hypothetical protein